MALEQHSVELELQLERFVSAIDKASANLEKIQATADRVGKASGKALGEGVNQSLSDTAPITKATSAFDSFLSVVGRVARTVLVGGGLYVGLNTIRDIMEQISSGNEKTAGTFFKFQGALQNTIAASAGLGRQFVGSQTALGQFFGEVQRGALNTNFLTQALNNLGKTSPGFKSFAGSFVAAFDTTHEAIGGLIQSIPGVVAAGNGVTSAFTSVRNSLTGAWDRAKEAVPAFKRIADSFVSIKTGAAAAVPGTQALGHGLESTAVAGKSASLAFDGVVPGVSFFANAANLATFALVAMNAAIIAVGVALTAVGNQFISVATQWAEQAGRTELAFGQLTRSVEATTKATGQSFGNIDSWNKFIKETARQAGFSNEQIAKLAFVYTQLAPSLKLNLAQTRELVRVTALVGKQYGDLDQALTAVKDAFVGIPGPALRLLGASIKQEKIAELTAKSLSLQTQAMSGLTDETERIAQTQEIFNIITQAAAPILDTVAASSDNLILVNQRLAGQVTNLNSLLGTFTQDTLSSLNRIITSLVRAIEELPPTFLAVVGKTITVLGVLFTLTGTFLKLAATVTLVTNATRIFNTALTIPVGTMGTVSQILSRMVTQFSGIQVEVKSASSLFSVAGAVILGAWRGIENAAARAILAMSNIAITIKPVALLTATWRGLISVLRVLPHLLIPTQLFVLIGALTALWKALVFLDEEYKILETLLPVINDFFRTNFEWSDILSIAMRKLGEVIELLALAFASGLQVAALGVVQIFLRLIQAGRLVNKVFDFMTFSVFGATEAYDSFVTGAEETAQVMEDRLLAGLVKTSDRMNTLVFTDMPNFSKKAAEVKKSTEEAAKATDKFEISLKVLVAVIETINKTMDNLRSNTAAAVDEQIVALQQLAGAHRDLARLTVDDERSRAQAIFEIDTKLNADILRLEETKASKTIELIRQQRDFELSVIDKIRTDDTKSLEDRVRKRAETVQKFRQSELDILTDLRGKLQQQLTSVQQAASQRVDIIRQARDRIKAIEDRVAQDIFELEFQKTEAYRQNDFVRQQIAIRRAQVEAALSRGEFERAQQLAESVTGLIQKIAAPDITSTIAKVAAVGVAQNVEAAKQKINELSGTIHASNAEFQKLSSAAFFATGPEDMAAIAQAAAQLQAALQRTAEAQKLDEQIQLTKEQAELQKRIEQERIQLAAQEQATFEQTGEIIKKKLTEIQEQIGTIRTQLEQPFEIIANFTPRADAVDLVIAELQKRQVNIPVIFTPKQTVDVPGGSPHRFEDVGKVVADIWNPGVIRAAFGPEFMQPNLGDGFQRANRASLLGTSGGTVRVDISLNNGETTPVNVASQDDADSLVKFAQSLKNMERTRGDYKSPLLRGSF